MSTTSPDVVRYEPRGAALELLRRKDPELLASGAAGTGKSVGALMKLHLACLQVPGVRALVVRKTHASLTSSTLVTFRKNVAAEALAAGVVHFYGGSAQEPAAFRYANGSTIVVGGLDRASRLLSTEFDLAFVDEAIEVTEEDLDTIVTRLRNGRLSYQQLIMATNPGPPTHHLKVRADAVTRGQVVDAISLFRAHVVDVAPDAVTIEATGSRSKLAALLHILGAFGIRELVQSGTVGLGRGGRSMTDRTLRGVSDRIA